MTNKIYRSLLAVSLLLTALAPASYARPEPGQVQSGKLVRQVRHELATLPYYGVYDWLQFSIGSDNVVTLLGQVVRPSTRSDAEAQVKDVDGVHGVINKIEVLPNSPEDERLRLAVYRAIYNYDSPLFRYATQSIPSIHIIVDHGRLTLKGIVSTKGDAEQANARARGVPGLFDVKSELTIESEQPG